MLFRLVSRAASRAALVASLAVAMLPGCGSDEPGSTSSGSTSSGSTSSGSTSSGSTEGSGSEACAGKACGEECAPTCPEGGCVEAVVAYCDAEGTCASRVPTCGQACTRASECPMPPPACETCGDGSQSCPNVDCVLGRCTVTSTCAFGCGPMDAQGDELCDGPPMGYAWNGQACEDVFGCTCAGADCDALHADASSCEAAHAGCP